MPTDRTSTFMRTIELLREEVGRLIVGHGDRLDEMLSALLAGGHVLVEGVPGIGKTRMVQSVARALALEFKRIQFTPDLMPGDITGSEILAPGGGPEGRAFRFERGPVFAEVVLADEINRATPKTQSALLEAMQERAVTVAGVRHSLGEPFFVIATQNPIEMAGTYPLPEAQLDRFMLKLRLEVPGEADLARILERTTGTDEPVVEAVASADELLAMQRLVREVPASSGVRLYVSRLVLATHPARPEAPEAVRRYVRHGASPRAAQALLMCAKAHALASGREHVGFSDIRRFAPAAMRHRLVLNVQAHAAGAEPDRIVEEAVASVKEPGDDS